MTDGETIMLRAGAFRAELCLCALEYMPVTKYRRLLRLLFRGAVQRTYAVIQKQHDLFLQEVENYARDHH